MKKTVKINEVLKVAEINLHIDRLTQIMAHSYRVQSDLLTSIRETPFDDLDRSYALQKIRDINEHMLRADKLLDNLRNQINPF